MQGDINNTTIDKNEEPLVTKTEDKLSVLEKELNAVKEIRAHDSKWATHRRVIAIGVICAILLTYIGIKIYPSLFPEPTCNDYKQNGLETGVDCGGQCQLMCKNSYKPLKIISSNYFKNSNGTYNFLTLVENDNTNSAPIDIEVNYELYGADGNRLPDLRASAYASLDNIMPIVSYNYAAPSTITKMQAMLSDYSMYKKSREYNIKLTDYEFENDSIPKLHISYTSLSDVRDGLMLLVILKDDLGNIINYGVQKSPALNAENNYDAYYTWDKTFEKNVNTVELIPVYN